MTYYFTAVCLVLAVVWITSTYGSRYAIWMVWWPSLIMPTYSYRQWGPLGVDLPTVVAGVILATGAWRTPPWRARWIIADYLAAGLVAALACSELFSSGGGLGSVIETLRRWLLPYALGRLALSWDAEAESELRVGVRVIAVVTMVIASCAVFEAVTHKNVMAILFGHEVEFMTRWGFRRASGHAEHTIGFGLFFVCLLPWAMEAARQSRRGELPWWGQLTPTFAVAGLIATVSRGPWLAGCLTYAGILFFRHPQWRRPMVTAAVAGTILLFVSRDQVTDLLNQAAGRNDDEQYFVIVKGDVYEYTGTNHRFLQFLIYEKQVWRAGVVGFGTDGMWDFRRAAKREIHIPQFPANVPAMFYSIDSHYLYFLLERGWLGMSLWCLCAALAVYYLATTPFPQFQELGHGLAAATVAVILSLATVFSHPPFEGVLLFYFGLASAWRVRGLTPHEGDHNRLGCMGDLRSEKSPLQQFR